MSRLSYIGTLALTVALIVLGTPKASAAPMGYGPDSETILWQLDGVGYDPSAAGWLVVNYYSPFPDQFSGQAFSPPFIMTLEGYGFFIWSNFSIGQPEFTPGNSVGPMDGGFSNCNYASPCSLSFTNTDSERLQLVLPSLNPLFPFFPNAENGPLSVSYQDARGDTFEFTDGKLAGTGVPEPASAVLMLTGGLTLLGLAWRKRGFAAQL